MRVIPASILKRITPIALLIICALPAFAQTQTDPVDNPHVNYFNASGAPCAGCTLTSYAAGTTTPQATYIDAAGSTPNTNPIILGTAGDAVIRLGPLSYKFILQDTDGSTIWTVDNVTPWTTSMLANEVMVAASGNSAAGFSDFNYYDAAGSSQAPGLFLTGAADVIVAPSIEVNLLEWNYSGSPIDPTGVVDSTTGIQNALNTVCSSTQRYLLKIPHGTYKVSSTLVCAQGLETHIVGEGKGNTFFSGTSALNSGSTVVSSGQTVTGIPLLQVNNSYKPYISGITFLCNSASPCAVGIEMRVKVPLGTNSWANNSSTIKEVAVNPALPSGSSSAVTLGIVYDHDAGSISSYCSLINGKYTCDLNNDHATLRDNDVFATQYSYEFVGGNSIYHNIDGGHIGGQECIHNVGGSFFVKSVYSCLTVINEIADPNIYDFPYLYARRLSGIAAQNVTELWRTDSTGVMGEGSVDDLDGSVGLAPPNLSGTVSTSGFTVTQVSGSVFTNAKAGEWMLVCPTATNCIGGATGTTYQIQTVSSSTSIILATSPGTLTGVYYSVGYAVDWRSASNAAVSGNFSMQRVTMSMGNGGYLNFTDTGSTVNIADFRGTPNAVYFANSLGVDHASIPTSIFQGWLYTGNGAQDLCVKQVIVNGVMQPTTCTNLSLSGGLFGYGSFSNLLKDSDWQANNPSGGSNTLWGVTGTTSGASTTAGASTDVFGNSNAMTITAGTLTTAQYYGVQSSASNEISVTAGQTVTLKVWAKGTAAQILFMSITTADAGCNGTAPNHGQLLTAVGTSFPALPYTVSCTFAANNTAQAFIGTETTAGVITVSHAEMTTASGYQLPVITTSATLAGTGFVKNGVVQGINSTAALTSGTVTITTPYACTVGASCNYKITNCGHGASSAIGTLSLGTITAGTSFVVNSLSATNTVVTGDASTICWQIN